MYSGKAQQYMIDVLLSYLLVRNQMPAVLATKTNPSMMPTEHFLPIWPQLWEKQDSFWYTTHVMMMRFNQGFKYSPEHRRQVVIRSEKAFYRVLAEILWQLCSWLMVNGCPKFEGTFFRQLLRFDDVIPNYCTSLFAVLVHDAKYTQVEI